MKRALTMTFLLIAFVLVFAPSPFAATDTLVPAGSTWKYLDNGSNQGTAWRGTGFSDAAWASGPAHLGYGDGDEATLVSYGGNASNKYTTTYFRRTFSVPDASIYQSLTLRLLRDDGAVVYLNGSEIFRSNMPGGTVAYNTFASSAIGGADESTFYETTLDSSLLANGDNVLAVEIHQANLTSSDVSFDLQLLASTDLLSAAVVKGPYLIYPGNVGEMEVLWQLDGTDTSTLEWGTDTSYSDGNVVSSEYGTAHQHRYTITGLSPAVKYLYRVTTGTNELTGSFVSAPGQSASNVKFLAYGDTRSYPGDHNSVCTRIMSSISSDPDYQTFILHVGDFVGNGDSESNWTSEYFPRAYPGILDMEANLPIQGCMGNHEGSGVLFVKYFPYPFTANRYWSFDYGPAHVAVLDQYVSYSTGSAQLTWLENDLATTPKLWKFILLHEPGYSAGGHGDNTSVRNYIQPLCEEYGVAIVFGGHNHYYARCEANGVTHLSCGSGGAPLYDPDPNYSPYVVATSRSYHFCEISIEGRHLTGTAIDRYGNVIDTFTIEHAAATSAGSWKTY